MKRSTDDSFLNTEAIQKLEEQLVQKAIKVAQHQHAMTTMLKKHKMNNDVLTRYEKSFAFSLQILRSIASKEKLDELESSLSTKKKEDNEQNEKKQKDGREQKKEWSISEEEELDSIVKELGGWNLSTTRNGG
jgi:Tfp pilus assembly protein FimV